MLVEFDDLLCLNDIAKILCVSRQRVDQMKHLLPQPYGKKGLTALWLKSDILKWNASRYKSKHKQLCEGKEYVPFTKSSNVPTPNQMKVLLKYLNGVPLKIIGVDLGIAEGTASAIIQHVKKKIGAKSIKDLRRKAIEQGLFTVVPQIFVNRIRCKLCGDVIESTSVHNFKSCKCGRVSVDGGHDYLRRVFTSPDDYDELSITNHKDVIECQLITLKTQVDMSDVDAVKKLAAEKMWFDLIDFINENPDEYNKWVMENVL